MEVKSKNNSIHAFLKVCDPEFDNESLCLYFPYKFHKERIEEAKNRRIVEEAIKRVYGKDYKITCVIRQSHNTSEKEKPKNDDLLKDALEIFGGEVVE
jgi:chromosomal replication initiation ATPase DnaA